MAYASSSSTMDQASPAPSAASSTASIPSISTPPPTSAVSDKADDSSKLRTFLSILRKYVVKLGPPRRDLSCHRLSGYITCALRARSHLTGQKTMLMGPFTRFIGVADIATVRFSLPSQLLEPIPNLGMLKLSMRRCH